MAKALLNRTLYHQMAERLLNQILEENRLPEAAIFDILMNH